MVFGLSRLMCTNLVSSLIDASFRRRTYYNNLNELFQSAYKERLSTETALVRIHNDVLLALKNQQSVILLLLDLSTAFDTVDHRIYSIAGPADFASKMGHLSGLRSYLSDRKQSGHELLSLC